MDDTAILQRLVSAGDVFDLLAREYDRRGDYADYEVCKRVALDMLLARLKDGALEAWSTRCSWDSYHKEGCPEKVPQEFWSHFFYAGPNCRSFDPVSGDFRFSYMGDDLSDRDGSAYAVFFDPQGLPGIAVPRWNAAVDKAPKKTETAEARNTSGVKGRPPANWWPAFAEELAIYCLEEGLPGGEGTDGQSDVIEAIFRRMAEKGESEPSRTTVQPVINAILRRWRSAGK
ncbi:MAG: hypothetical protein AB7E05_08525 [Sphingobium sp.]